jgi:pimeloyl-ACP methyl ester carboxylesterase
MDPLPLLRSFNALAGRIAPAVPARLARNLMLRPRRGGRAGRDAGARRIRLRSGVSALHWGDAGPAVLLLHGWEGEAAQFAPLARRLVAACRQAFALDAPAHGRSPGREATLMGFARALLETAAEIPRLEAVGGHSLGAAATALALARGLPVQRAALVAAPASMEGYLRRFAHAIALPPASTARFIRLLEEANGVPVTAFEIARIAASLDVPALIVHDGDDPRVPLRDGEAIARAWRGARLLATRGLGHSRVLRDEGVLAQLAGFLAGEPAGVRPARVTAAA